MATKDAQYLALLGRAYLRHGDVAKGLGHLEQASEAAPGVAATLAIGHLAQGDLDQKDIELPSSINPGQSPVQADVLLIMYQMQNQDFSSAMQSARSLSEKLPASPVPRNLQGAAYVGMGEFKAARVAFEEALRIEPGYVPSHLNMARLDLLTNDTNAAKARYDKVLSIDEGNLPALLALAALAERDGHAKEAEELLQQAHAHHPEAIKPALMLVERYLLQNKITAALDIAREVINIHPRNPEALRVLAIAQLRTGENKQAAVTIRTLSEVMPLSPQGYYLLALIQWNQMEVNAARKNLRQALELKGDFPKAQVALGRIEIANKDFNVALKIADRLQQAHPDSVYGYELKGDVLAVRKEYKQAAAVYKLGYDKSGSSQLAHKLFRSRLLAGEGKSAHEDIKRWLVEHPGEVAVRRLLASAELSLASAALAAGQQQTGDQDIFRDT